ncbi:hypothetical protein EGJ52_03865 [Pseudomonas luteola]|uniref:hypothetical protein n=1 Tax=Pseudomonas luteola TaxID=47886 RepID=UPI000F7B1517|nr:hypothetical protein [Pseudomonas luteola]RRW46510.1 hypothetical protein EGJ52_03865 [Pseudomonas luteola]
MTVDDVDYYDNLAIHLHQRRHIQSAFSAMLSDVLKNIIGRQVVDGLVVSESNPYLAEIELADVKAAISLDIIWDKDSRVTIGRLTAFKLTKFPEEKYEALKVYTFDLDGNLSSINGEVIWDHSITAKPKRVFNRILADILSFQNDPFQAAT